MGKKSKLTVYRGITDVLPSEIDHLFYGGGVFGGPTYFALEDSTARAYALGESESYLNFGIVCEYEIELKNIIELSEDDFIGLESAMDLTMTERGLKRFKGMLPKKLKASHLIKAISKHWSGVILEESTEGSIPEGNRQLILPENTNIEPTLVSFTVLADPKLLKALKVGKPYQGVFVSDIPASKLRVVSERIELHLAGRSTEIED